MDGDLRRKTKPFSTASDLRSLFELVVAVLGYGLSLYGLYITYTTQLWVGYVPLCIVGSLFMVKIFVLLHDCAHDSMFTSETLNLWGGRFLSLFITMPFTSWKTEHEDHHSHVVDIDKIGHGDVLLLTVEQYQALSKPKRLFYRVFRHPVFFLLFAPFLYFFVKSRFPGIFTKEVVLGVLLTNVAVAAIYLPILLHFGFWTTVFVFMPAAYLGGMIGVALFYLQHDHAGAQWYKTEDWDHERASLDGSSLIILPQPLEWFSHAIGYHHIHHLNSKIPGYRLRECYETVPELQGARPLSWRDVTAAFTLKLWSNERQSLVTFAEAVRVGEPG